MKLKTAQLGLLLAFALVLSYIEAILPISFGIPGIKLGLPNLAILICLYLFGWKEGILVNLCRIFLSGFLFGNMVAILYSLCGAALSFLFMVLLKRTDRFSILGVSICGGVMHNVGQLLIAIYIVRINGILWYLPVLLIAGMITGALIGIISGRVLPYLQNAMKGNENKKS